MATNPPPALEIVRVNAGYRGRPILREVSLSVQAGRSIALIGPNGCGKSTLFRVATGIIGADDGAVYLEGAKLENGPADKRIRLGLGYLMQTRNVFAGLTVRENLLLAGNSVKRTRADGSKLRLQRLLELFPGVARLLDQRAGLLSGGQRQALAVAMVVMRPVPVLLLDEPIAGLSPSAAVSLMTAVRTLQAEEGFAMIVAEHRLKLVQPHVDRVVVMREGRIVDETTDTERMLDPAWLATHYMNGVP